MHTPHRYILAPSLLAGKHANLQESLRQIENTKGVSWVHLDIMDGHFVPNISFGPQAIGELRESSQLFFDVHLMLSHPDRYIDAFLKAGSNHITIHAEPSYPIKETLEHIKQSGAGAGICINPDTPCTLLEPYLDTVDLVLLMTVQPGFGGQAFRKDVLKKIEQLAQWRQTRALSYRIQVDGGIQPTTGKLCKEVGADTFVAGTAFFNADNRSAFLEDFQHSSQP